MKQFAFKIAAQPFWHYSRNALGELKEDNAWHGPLTIYVKLWAVHAPGMFSRQRLQRKPLVNDPGMHHGTCLTWCMSGSLTRGGGENVLGIPGACATHNFTHLVRGPWHIQNISNSRDWLCTMGGCLFPKRLVFNYQCNRCIVLPISNWARKYFVSCSVSEI